MNEHVPQLERIKTPEVSPADIVHQLALIVMTAEEQGRADYSKEFIAVKGTSKEYSDDISGVPTRVTLYLAQESSIEPDVQRLAHIVYREDGLLVARDLILTGDKLTAASIKKNKRGVSIYRVLDTHQLSALGERLDSFEPGNSPS